MSEWYGATIYIGGQLPTQRLPEFIAALKVEVPGLKRLDDTLSPEEFMGIFDKMLGVEDSDFMIESKGNLRFYTSEAQNGAFLKLEGCCIRYGLSYIRYSESVLSCNTEVEWYTPDLKYPKVSHCGNDYQVTIAAETLKEMIKTLQTFKVEDAPLHLEEGERTTEYQEFLARWSLNNPWDPLKALKSFVDYYSPEPPKFPGRFEIVP